MFDSELIEKSNTIESFLEDDLSRDIFKYRLLANLTSDVRYVHTLLKKHKLIDFNDSYNMWRKIKDNYDIYPNYDVLTFLQTRNENRKIVLFGAGHDSLLYISLLDAAGITPVAIIDNYTPQEELCGIRIYRPCEYSDLNKSTVIISSRINKNSMLEDLRTLGVSEEQIFIPDVNALYIFSQREYFDREIWAGGENEVYVDAGAYNLATVKDFLGFTKSCERILAFEPDEKNYELCLDEQKKIDIDNLELIKAGLWECDTELYFRRGGDNGTGTAVSDDTEGTFSVKVRSLDGLLQGQRCSFIKMDIEGSELNALKGAKETIQQYKPRLAICLYHKPEDLIEIPLFIHEIVPEYKIKIRHYSTWFYDTVLYAYV